MGRQPKVAGLNPSGGNDYAKKAKKSTDKLGKDSSKRLDSWKKDMNYRGP